MAPVAGMVAEAVGRAERVLDLAAGHGLYGIAVARANPGATIVAQDWEQVLAVARENAERAGVADRLRLLPGSAFEVDFGEGFDLVLVPNFLHHFDPPTCVALLRRVHDALAPGGRAAIVEFVPDAEPGVAAGAGGVQPQDAGDHAGGGRVHLRGARRDVPRGGLHEHGDAAARAGAAEPGDRAAVGAVATGLSLASVSLAAGWILLALGLGVVLVLIAASSLSGERTVEHEIEHLYAVREEQFLRSMSTLLGPTILTGNRVTALCNGDEIFPAMLEAMRSATRTITFETYIYWSGSIGKALAEVLAERARAGVRVHVVLDWVGSGKIDQALLQGMERAGVEVVRYHPLRWYNLGRLNNRTHRKLLVVDGTVAFTGGVGIADNWLGNAEDPEHWRDSHFRLEGPAVAQMQAAFMDNWIEARGRVLHGDGYFPKLEPAGTQAAQVFKSSASEASESVRFMYLLSIASAERSVRIANAYFVPDRLAIATLVAARRRGVRVEIIVPGRHVDAKVVRQASRSRWGALLEGGVAIYEYQPTMYHTKVMVVDDLWTSVGSTNFDSRSFRLNDEANLNVYDAEFAGGQARQFEADKAQSKEMTLAWWRGRAWHERAAEELAGLLRSQL